MERFDHDDDGYLRWVAVHPSGVVINCFPNLSTDYLVLHRSTCPSITIRQVDKEALDARLHQGVRRGARRDPGLVLHGGRGRADALSDM